MNKDDSALSELYTRYGGHVFGLCLRVLKERNLAEEATQDTFMKVWHNAAQWNPDRGTLRTWLLTVARYTAVDRLRKEKRQTPPTAIGLDDVLTTLGTESGMRAGKADDADLLRELVNSLPEDQIEAIRLAFFQGMTHTEIASYLQQPLGTVKSRIRSGLQTLRGLWMRETE